MYSLSHFFLSFHLLLGHMIIPVCDNNWRDLYWNNKSILFHQTSLLNQSPRSSPSPWGRRRKTEQNFTASYCFMFSIIPPHYELICSVYSWHPHVALLLVWPLPQNIVSSIENFLTSFHCTLLSQADHSSYDLYFQVDPSRFSLTGLESFGVLTRTVFYLKYAKKFFCMPERR